MTAFNSNKLLYLVLCCINATLLVLILVATSHPPPPASRSGAAPHSHTSMTNMPTSKFVRKMAMATSLLHHLPHQYHLDQALYHSTHMVQVPLCLSKFIMGARRSLLQEPRTTKVVIDANREAAKTSANFAHDHLPHHDEDVSATFHVDYSGPKTHPPKNN